LLSVQARKLPPLVGVPLEYVSTLECPWSTPGVLTHPKATVQVRKLEPLVSADVCGALHTPLSAYVDPKVSPSVRKAKQSACAALRRSAAQREYSVSAAP
jgi:glycine/D-amino acid oxidase-like deaminating enzyme